MPPSLPCLYGLADIERDLRVPVAAILGWVKRGELAPAATDPGGRPLFRAADVATIGRRLAAAEPVRLFPGPTERQRRAAAVADWNGGAA